MEAAISLTSAAVAISVGVAASSGGGGLGVWGICGESPNGWLKSPRRAAASARVSTIVDRSLRLPQWAGGSVLLRALRLPRAASSARRCLAKSSWRLRPTINLLSNLSEFLRQREVGFKHNL